MKSFLTLIAILVSFAVYCQAPSTNEINKVASSFLNAKNSRLQIKLKNAQIPQIEDVKSVKVGEKILFHVAELDPTGYVVISNDKRIDPVIAYSSFSKFNYKNDSTNALYYLLVSSYGAIDDASLPKEDLWDAEENKLKSASLDDFQQWPEEHITKTGGWIQTAWHQTEPYNLFCPEYSGYNSVIGCVPLAISQLIHYHGYISSNELDDQYSYITRSRNINIDKDSTTNNFPSFNRLNRILDDIRSKFDSRLELSEDEVAALNFIAGITSKANYTRDATSTSYWDSYLSLKYFWGYSELKSTIHEVDSARMAGLNARFEINDEYHPANFVVKENIIQGYPCLLIIGDCDPVSHMVIMDGYNSDNFFHVNFGWGENSPAHITEAWVKFPSVYDYFGGKDIWFNIKPPKDNQLFSTRRILLKNKNAFDTFMVNSDDVLSSVPLKDFQISVDGVTYSNQLDAAQISSASQFYVRFTGDTLCTEQLSFKFRNGTEKFIELIGVPDENYMLTRDNFPEIIEASEKPYFVDELIEFKEGSMLKIMPGVRIFFSGHGGLKFGNNSTIKAIGTPQNRITFNALSNRKSWYGITINKSYTDTSYFSYCNFLNCTWNLYESKVVNYDMKSALKIKDSNVSITNCNFINNNLAVDLSLSYGSTNNMISPETKITNCLFSNNFQAVCLDGTKIAPINYCTFVNNEIGIYLLSTFIPLSVHNSVLVKNRKDFEYASMNSDDEHIIKSVQSQFINCISSFSNINLADGLSFKNDDERVGYNWDKIVYDKSFKPNSLNKNKGTPFNDLPELDLLGNNRVSGMFPDIGAYEDQSIGKSIVTNPVSKIDFGYVYAGQEKTEKVLIYNPDYEALHIQNITIEDSSSSFKVKNKSSLNFIIPPLSYDSVLISFTPKFTSLQEARLIIKSDANSFEYPLNLCGTGVKGTMVSGYLSGTWDSIHSPYVLINNVIIDGLKGLTVMEGVEIIFTGNHRILANSAMRINGTKNNKVIIRSLGEHPALCIRTNTTQEITLNNVQIEGFYKFIEGVNANVKISECEFDTCGIAIDLTKSAIELKNNIFKNCYASSSYPSSLIRVSNPSSVLVDGNLFMDNQVQSVLDIEEITIDLTLSNNCFKKNSYNMFNGINTMISIRGQGNLTLNSNIIENNNYSGGILHFYNYSINSKLFLRNNIITNNNASHRNSPTQLIVMKFNNDNLATVENNTICKNVCSHIFNNQTLKLFNNIFVDNYLAAASNTVASFSSSSIISMNNLFKNSFPVGENCLFDVDPEFVNPSKVVGNYMVDSTYNWRLQPFSVCIDAGIDSVKYNDIEDKDKPGYALYPSQGTIRNDLGAYGGNFAIGHITYTPVLRKRFDILLYPNPIIGRFWIRFNNEKPANYQVWILNELGQIQYENEFYSNDYLHIEEFNVSFLPKGSYFVRVFDGISAITQKIILM